MPAFLSISVRLTTEPVWYSTMSASLLACGELPACCAISMPPASVLDASVWEKCTAAGLQNQIYASAAGQEIRRGFCDVGGGFWHKRELLFVFEHALKPDVTGGVLDDDAHFCQLLERRDTMPLSRVDDPLCGYGADARNAEQVIGVGMVDINREKPGLTPGNDELGVLLKGQVIAVIKGKLYLAEGKAINAQEPVHLIEAVFAHERSGGVVFEAGMGYGLKALKYARRRSTSL